MDLEIIEMINQFKNESEQTVEEQIATGALKNISIGDTTIIFEERQLLDGKVSIRMPSDFTTLPPELAKLKYPSANRPSVIYSNATATINITFNHTEMPLEEAEVELFKEYMAENLPNSQSDGEWVGDGIEEINGQTVGYCEFIVPAEGANIYNMLFFLSLQGKALLCSFNCIEEDMEDWQPIARGMLRSFNVSSGSSSEAINKLRLKNMSMEHKAFLFDTKGFNRELVPLILDSGSKGDPELLKKYIKRNLFYLSSPDPAEKKIRKNWEDGDIQMLADLALTAFYSVEEDQGLLHSWNALLEAFKNLPLQFAPEYYILGKPLKNEAFTLDPGEMGMGFVEEKDIIGICRELAGLKKGLIDNGLPVSEDLLYEISLEELTKAYGELFELYQMAGRMRSGLMFRF